MHAHFADSPKPGTTNVTSGVNPNQLSMGEDEHPQCANTAQTSAELDKEIAEMKKKWGGYRRANEMVSTENRVKSEHRQRKTVYCWLCQKRTEVAKAAGTDGTVACRECGHVV